MVQFICRLTAAGQIVQCFPRMLVLSNQVFDHRYLAPVTDFGRSDRFNDSLTVWALIDSCLLLFLTKAAA